MKGNVQIQVRGEDGQLMHGVRYDVDDVDAALNDLKDCQGDTDATDDQVAGGAQPLGSNAGSSDSSTEGAQPLDAASSTDGSSTPPAAKKRTARKSTKRQR